MRCIAIKCSSPPQYRSALAATRVEKYVDYKILKISEFVSTNTLIGHTLIQSVPPYHFRQMGLEILHCVLRAFASSLVQL